MITVIKPGKLPQEKKFRVDCTNCGCIFEFEKKDARHTSDQRNGDFLTIACPTCRMSAHVDYVK